MRVRSVWISSYKNLRDLSLEFSGDEFIDIFVGKNGSGKSNFLEALIEIFDHLFTYKSTEPGPGFDYEVSWTIKGELTKIAWKNGRLWINDKARIHLGSTPLPTNIVVYYSGQNETVSALVKRYRDKYRKKIKNSDVVDLPRFVGIGPDYKSVILALMLMMPETNRARQILCEKLGIEIAGGSTWLTLKRPSTAKKNKRFDPFSEAEFLWGVQGRARRFLDELLQCISDAFNPGELYDRASDTYQIELNIDLFRKQFADRDAEEIFSLFNALFALGMIDDMSIPIRIGNEVEVTSKAFSDGQFQSVYLFAISELFKDRECLTLLDEPDAFLHPEWQFEFLSQVQQISEAAARTNHILMTSHSAATLIPHADRNIRFFELKNGFAKCNAIPKRVAIGKLSSNLIKYSEQEQLLSILNAIQIENKPVLFTEGSTDPIIITEAWSRFSDEPIPFIPFYAFSCTYLKQLLTDDRILNEMNGRPVFGLFDIDQAYHHWNGLRGVEDSSTEIQTGRIKRLGDTGERNSFAMLLPVPDNERIRAQVLRPDGTCFGGSSLCEIEHLFYGDPLTADYFDEEAVPGGGTRIVIRSDSQKEHFAREIIPRLEDRYFAVFAPMFTYMAERIAGSGAE
jgi:predicted ATPase